MQTMMLAAVQATDEQLIVYKWRHREVIIIKLKAGTQN